LPSEETGIEYKNKKENMTDNNKRQIPYECKIGDQLLLETPGIPPKLPTSRTGPYLVTDVYKNGKIRIQNGKKDVSERGNIRRITPFNQKPIKNDLGGNDIP
jgi:hypothetical protein